MERVFQLVGLDHAEERIAPIAAEREDGTMSAVPIARYGDDQLEGAWCSLRDQRLLSGSVGSLRLRWNVTVWRWGWRTDCP